MFRSFLLSKIENTSKAGNGASGYSGDGGLALVAGVGIGGLEGDGGPATSARLNNPTDGL